MMSEFRVISGRKYKERRDEMLQILHRMSVLVICSGAHFKCSRFEIISKQFLKLSTSMAALFSPK